MMKRQIFTAAHELGHLLLHPEAFIADRVEENVVEEREADAFASHFLMPEATFAKEWREAYGQSVVPRVLHVKRIFRVSYKTVLYRLLEQGQVDAEIWKRFAYEYRRRYGKSLGYRDEPALAGETVEPSSLADADFMEDRLHGLVRRAVEQEEISSGRAAEILDVSISELREILASWKVAP